LRSGTQDDSSLPTFPDNGTNSLSPLAKSAFSVINWPNVIKVISTLEQKSDVKPPQEDQVVFEQVLGEKPYATTSSFEPIP
jgi:hypothetical protein